MTEFRRKLMIEVIADCQNPWLPQILFHFSHLPYCDYLLTWMIRKKYVGQTFLNLFIDCCQSPMETAKEVVRRFKKEAQRQPFFAGKDYIIQ